MRFFFVRTSFLLAALIAAPAAQLLAQTVSNVGENLQSTGLMFRVLGEESGTFVIATQDGTQGVSYDLAAGRISFRTFDNMGRDKPLFCFDFGESDGATPIQLRLLVRNSSNHLALDSIRLTSSLGYSLNGEAGAISFTPDPKTQCFYIGDVSESFGLFGQAPEPVPAEPVPDQDVIFHDDFELFIPPSLQVWFQGIPESVGVGQTLSYGLVIKNAGDVDFTTLAFQEVYPGNATVFDAALDGGSWTCSGNHCPAAEGTGLIRFNDATLPVGESIEFEIFRLVDAAVEGGSQIKLYAGAVNGPGSSASFGGDQATVSVFGAPARVVFVNDNTPVARGETKTLSIQIQDASHNLVSTDSRFLDLSRALGQGTGQVSPTAGTIEIINGVSSFEVTGTLEGTLTLVARTLPGEPSLTPGSTTFTVTAPP